MPDTKGQAGDDNFAAYADAIENKSSSSRFATYKTVQGTGGDGSITIEERGEPSDLALPVDFAPDEPPKSKKKKK